MGGYPQGLLDVPIPMMDITGERPGPLILSDPIIPLSPERQVDRFSSGKVQASICTGRYIVEDDSKGSNYSAQEITDEQQQDIRYRTVPYRQASCSPDSK